MDYLTPELVFYYMYATVLEWIEYWYIYLILTLPAYLFTQNAPNQLPNEETAIWFNQIKLVLQPHKNEFNTENLVGTQLLALADENGYITFNKLSLYYPTLDTLYLKYLRVDLTNNTSEEITKVIDIAKKLDLRSIQKCKFGRITL